MCPAPFILKYAGFYVHPIAAPSLIRTRSSVSLSSAPSPSPAPPSRAHLRLKAVKSNLDAARKLHQKASELFESGEAPAKSEKAGKVCVCLCLCRARCRCVCVVSVFVCARDKV